MSFILDALKRAERERRLERPPDLTAVYEEDHLSRQGIQPWLWLGGAFLIGAVVVGLILWPEGPGPARAPVSTDTSAARSSPATAAVKKEKSGLSPVSPKVTVRKPTETASVQLSPPRSAPAPVKAPPPKAGPAPTRVNPPPRTAETAAKTAPRTSWNKRAERPKEKPNLNPRQQNKADSAGPADPVLTTDETTPIQPATPVIQEPKEALAKPETTQPSPPPPAHATAKPDLGKTSSIPLLNELPLEVRGKLGKLQINVHSYSENPDERMVFINMKRFKVGDSIGENGPVLKEITPDGAIIDYGEGQARLQIWR